MRKITVLAAMLMALSTSAVAQIGVDTDNRVGQPGAVAKSKGGPGSPTGIMQDYYPHSNVKAGPSAKPKTQPAQPRDVGARW